MSCDGDSCFGYVEIKDGKVVSYTGESNNPTVHSFCNDDIVQAMKLKEIVKNWIVGIKANSEKFPYLAKSNEWSITMLESMLAESKK